MRLRAVHWCNRVHPPNFSHFPSFTPLTLPIVALSSTPLASSGNHRTLHVLRQMTFHSLNRRQFLLSLSAAAAASRFRFAAASPLFEEIPPSRSGILGPRQRHVPRTLPARNHGPRLRVPGLRQRRLDGHLSGQQRPLRFLQARQAPIRNALYKNNRDGTFTDVTEKAGVAGGTFGMGVAVGDYDNDGFPDIFVTAYGRTHSLSQQRRRHVHRRHREGRPCALDGWTTSAVWFDFDNDGRLDLFVCSFVDYGTPTDHLSCGDNKLGRSSTAFRASSSPRQLSFPQQRRRHIHRSRPRHRYRESARQRLGVVATDINNDGRMDLFVANDTVQNFLFVNRGRQRQTSGKRSRWPPRWASARTASARSGMGVDAADFDGDGWQDLFVANVDQEMFSLYQNNKNETFPMSPASNGVAQATRLLSGWGLKFFDYDNDGDVDLILANGHPDDMIDSYSQPVKYKEPLLLFHQENGKLRNVSAEAGPAFSKTFAARGLAIGDFDNDGRLDVLIGNNGGAPVLLRNNAGAGQSLAGGQTARREMQSRRDRRAPHLVGRRRQALPPEEQRRQLPFLPRSARGSGPGHGRESRLAGNPLARPSTRIDRLTNIPADRYITITEGKS